MQRISHIYYLTSILSMLLLASLGSSCKKASSEQAADKIENLQQADTTSNERTFTIGDFTPDDAYDEGYDEGYENGRKDARQGLEHGHSFNNGTEYYGDHKDNYKQGYSEGYNEGFTSIN